jgi:hypothetical protein
MVHIVVHICLVYKLFLFLPADIASPPSSPPFFSAFGVTAVFSCQVFHRAGLSSPILGSILVGVLNVGITLLAAGLMDRYALISPPSLSASRQKWEGVRRRNTQQLLCFRSAHRDHAVKPISNMN